MITLGSFPEMSPDVHDPEEIRTLAYTKILLISIVRGINLQSSFNQERDGS